MNPRIHTINKNLIPFREEITNHNLYKRLKNVNDIAVLMEHHVYAVWDFMSLLKALQSNLTCTSSPWKPVGDSAVRRLINSIVLEEESDVDADGAPSSHYEMYLDAMEQCGANTAPVEKFVSQVTTNHIPSVNSGVDDFLNTTFSVIDSNEPHKIASAFTFGREDLIPDMFTAIVNEYNKENKLDKFVYYLERHIELDGGDHGPLALELICSLCGDDEQKWKEVEETAILCLKARKKLWDLILENIN